MMDPLIRSDTNAEMATTSVGARRGKAQAVVTTLRRELVDGLIEHKLRPGDQLPKEAEMLERFDVARPTLREALRILEADGLIELRVGAAGGIYLRAPGTSTSARHLALQLQLAGATFEDVFRVRIALGSEAARVLAAASDESVLRLLDAIVAVAWSKLDDGPAVTEACFVFERELIWATGNTAARVIEDHTFNIMASQWMHGVEFLPLSEPQLRKRSSVLLKALERLIELVRAGDPDGAAEFWSNHREALLKVIVSYLGSETVIDAGWGMVETGETGGRRTWHATEEGTR